MALRGTTSLDNISTVLPRPLFITLETPASHQYLPNWELSRTQGAAPLEVELYHLATIDLGMILHFHSAGTLAPLLQCGKHETVQILTQQVCPTTRLKSLTCNGGWQMMTSGRGEVRRPFVAEHLRGCTVPPVPSLLDTGSLASEAAWRESRSSCLSCKAKTWK
jgi:hypothetical protein